jgi:hypothetical protein
MTPNELRERYQHDRPIDRAIVMMAADEIERLRGVYEQKVNDAYEFVEGMKIMELHRIKRGMIDQVNLVGLLESIQAEIRRPILHLEETK